MRPEGFGYEQCMRCGTMRKEGTIVKRTKPRAENDTETWSVCDNVAFCDGVIAWLKTLEVKL